MDRGRGNIYEASYDSPVINTISNTVVPKIYESVWNRDLTAFIGSILQSDDSTWLAVYSRLVKQPTTTDSQTTPFALKGEELPSNVVAYEISPKKDRVFTLTNDSGNGVGYVSNVDGSKLVKIFSTPLTQLNASWPSDNIIALTTKGSSSYSGYLYFVNPKTGAWTKVIGPVTGLSAVVSHDGKFVLWSGTGLSLIHI